MDRQALDVGLASKRDQVGSDLTVGRVVPGASASGPLLTGYFHCTAAHFHARNDVKRLNLSSRQAGSCNIFVVSYNKLYYSPGQRAFIPYFSELDAASFKDFSRRGWQIEVVSGVALLADLSGQELK
ncbi:hypothetical protein Tco_1303101 [Tanacetum coccineum]